VTFFFNPLILVLIGKTLPKVVRSTPVETRAPKQADTAVEETDASENAM